MLPVFLVEEATVRDSGEGIPFQCAEGVNRTLTITLGITHAVERQSLELEIYGSDDGVNWTEKPILTLPPKFYCGTYEASLLSSFRYLRAAWHLKRWGGGDRRPYFRFYVFSEPARARAMAGAA